MGRVRLPRPLTADDDRTTFDCGRVALNHWFHRHAWSNQAGGASRTNVVTDAETDAIAGYVSLCAGHVEREFLPKAARRNRPDPVPIILLGQLAVGVSYQGQGVARSLMRFAFATSVRVAQEIGCVGLVTFPIDAGVRDFYEAFGFEELVEDPQRNMIVWMRDLVRNGFNGGGVIQ